MSEYKARVEWSRGDSPFAGSRYSRGHRWLFDGGIEVPASSSPQVVPVPHSIEAAVDPEEAFVASLSSCHMLWFLSIADRRGFIVDSYRDEPIGIMARDASGKLAITRVTLYPEATFDGRNPPTPDDVLGMHEQAHEQCFIARSVKTQVRCDPVRASSPSLMPREAVP
ncbi:MAG TPA: OsmC family protein [Rhodanobacteraceae bacterium]|nr:OsmC family protein [Rhodanobacteraceae bacterium]